jgi:Arc/MetJ-type ribon-helix-helix transcriptional regulator
MNQQNKHAQTIRNLYINEYALNKHGDGMNVNLGAPYVAIINKIIERGYSGNQTEAIRQALLAYNRELEEEEVRLVNKGIETEMKEIRAGRVKLYSHAEIKKKYGIK